MEKQAEEFMNLMKHPVKSGMFLLSRLPSAFFAGVRVKDMDENKCIVTVPYKWFTKNPFRSTYFACLGMAAEMSTGGLCMAHLYKKNPAVSMLVVKIEGEYFKKAVDKTTFICEDGGKIKKAIDDTIAAGDAAMVRAKSTGRNKEGELVAEFFITWSFKAKIKNEMTVRL